MSNFVNLSIINNIFNMEFEMPWRKNSENVQGNNNTEKDVEKVVRPTETMTGRVITPEEEKSLKEEREARGGDSWREQK